MAGLIGYVNRESSGAGDLGSTTRERDDVVVGLDQRTGELSPDESTCPDHSDSHVSTVHPQRIGNSSRVPFPLWHLTVAAAA